MPAPPDLLLVCFTAFTAVFVLLGALALLMRGMMALFPGATIPDAPSSDPAMVAAITTAATAAFPGAAITKIEEVR